MSDTQQFIAAIVGSTAWPVAIVIIALAYRETLHRHLWGEEEG